MINCALIFAVKKVESLVYLFVLGMQSLYHQSFRALFIYLFF